MPLRRFLTKVHSVFFAVDFGELIDFEVFPVPETVSLSDEPAIVLLKPSMPALLSFVNVDEVAGKATVSVKKLDCWKNLVWEFRKRDADEAQQVFGDYFVAATESGPFAEMIEAISEKIREAATVWMNKTAFDALRTDFVAKLDEELTNRLCEEKEALSLIEQDAAAIKAMSGMCYDLKDQMKRL